MPAEKPEPACGKYSKKKIPGAGDNKNRKDQEGGGGGDGKAQKARTPGKMAGILEQACRSRLVMAR